MTTWQEILTPKVEVMEDDRIRITLSVEGEEKGVLYFERAKKGYVNKPIIQNGWACIDAKVDGLYIYSGENATPKDLVAWCQQLINELVPNP